MSSNVKKVLKLCKNWTNGFNRTKNHDTEKKKKKKQSPYAQSSDVQDTKMNALEFSFTILSKKIMDKTEQLKPPNEVIKPKKKKKKATAPPELKLSNLIT